MTAIEVLEWLSNVESDKFEAVFGVNKYSKMFCTFTPQEIVSRIEKYEAKKKHITNDKKAEQEFKVGDLVRYNLTYFGKHYSGISRIIELGQIETTGNIVYGVEVDGVDHPIFTSADTLEHAEPPKEEMTPKKCIELLKNEINCVKSNDTCSHECADCELVKPPEDILEMYDIAIKAVERLEPKEEKQKIEKITDDHLGDDWIAYENIRDKINELVDAVNELRGVE